MISIRKYLDGVGSDVTAPVPQTLRPVPGQILLTATIGSYCSTLREVARCSVEVCPAHGQQLNDGLGKVVEELAHAKSAEAMASVEESARIQVRDWGHRTARHYQQKAAEVKDILLAMARTAESVGESDQLCAQQIDAVTTQLRNIANLDDLTQIRTSIQRSAADLKSSIERMTAEGKAALEHLRTEVSSYQAKLEEAEKIAWRDALTHLGNRLWVEGQIEARIAAGSPFCVSILDIDQFKRVNDEHGHMVGDQLLKQFAAELRSASRSTDVIGRWGGDEFIVVMNCGLAEAEAQIDRVSKWVCGNYTLSGGATQVRLLVHASIGVAESSPAETMTQLIDRADASMYRHKAASRVKA
jgi:diguanylate cyclase (GGDEF)-like protein